MTVREAQARIDAHEVAEWQAYFMLEPWGAAQADLRNGLLCAITHNAWTTGPAASPSEFMHKPPEFAPSRGGSHRRREPEQTPEEMHKALHNLSP